MSNKKNLENITEKYSFLGRRKYNHEIVKDPADIIEKEDYKHKTTVKVENNSPQADATDSSKSKLSRRSNIVNKKVKLEPVEIDIEENNKIVIKSENDISVKTVKVENKRIKQEPIETDIEVELTEIDIEENNKIVIKSENDISVKTVKVENKRIKQEPIETDIEDCGISGRKTVQIDEDVIKWFPKNWEEMLKNIREMRKNQSAPVDNMGCHKTMDDNAPPKVQRYQALISLMLSSQTRDQVTYAAMLRLRENDLTVESVLNMSESTLEELIKPVGFWKTKAKHILKTTQILKEEYDGDIPDTVDKMLKLPGVGPKMSHLCMKTAWGKVHGIGVDTHVHRISNRLKWVQKPTKTAEETRKALEKWLPPALWYEVNHLMVGFGQQICLPRFPKCSDCLNVKICPFKDKNLKKSKKSS